MRCGVEKGREREVRSGGGSFFSRRVWADGGGDQMGAIEFFRGFFWSWGFVEVKILLHAKTIRSNTW